MSADAEWCGQCFTSLRSAPDPEPPPVLTRTEPGEPREGEKVTHHDGDLPRGHFNVRPDQDAAHLKDWIDAVRDRKPPRCPIEVGVNAAGASHLGNDAYRQGKLVNWPDA